MLQGAELAKIVDQAQRGQAESRECLARQAEPIVRAYIYRVTLDADLTEDLTQETMLSMFESLEELNSPQHFWPWLYGIAQNKILQYYRYKQQKAAISASAFYGDFLSHQPDHREDDALRRLLKQELSSTVMSAMKELKYQYRAVLSLRCFDRLSYAEIATAMQCSKIGARVLFFRAKQALKRQLQRQGISPTLVITGLGLFGQLTAPTESLRSMVKVTPASVRVGLTGALVGIATSRVGLTITAAVVAGLAVICGLTLHSSESSLPAREQVRSVHYITQERSYGTGVTSSLSKGAYEQWYYFPDGIEGPMFMKMQRWDPKLTCKLCAWLQNDQANFYYHSGEGKVYITNYRLWRGDLRVMRLPCDEPEFTSFLSRVEGDLKGVEYSRDKRTGLLRQAVDRRFLDAPLFKTIYEYNTLQGQQFEYYWPSSVPVVDLRDQMHKRGWTYFQIKGKVNGRKVTGRGQVPFVYASLERHQPWLELNVGQDIQVIDCNRAAVFSAAGDFGQLWYPAGSFFKGLARPWMGMHTVDIVRRDAAEQRIWFDTSISINGNDAIVTLLIKEKEPKLDLIYMIDLSKDVLKCIKYKVNDRSVGRLDFYYIQDVNSVAAKFVEPTLPATPQKIKAEDRGILWLADLVLGGAR